MIISNNLVNNLKKIIPSSIIDLGLTTILKNKTWIRFDNDLLNSVYIECKPLSNCISTILKFSYNTDFVFTGIYLTYEKFWYDINTPSSFLNPNKEYKYEFRYDSNLNLTGRYKNYNRDIPEIRIATSDYENKRRKIAENCEKDDNTYWKSTIPKKFKEYNDFLTSNNFIDYDGIDECAYMFREDDNIIYLVVRGLEVEI